MKSGTSYGNNLRRLATIINTYEPAFDKSQIDTLIEQCIGLSSADGYWSYNMKDFAFPNKSFKAAKLDKVHPQATKNYKVLLSVKASGRFLEPGDLSDPIKDLSVNVVVTDLPGSTPDSIFCAWHLDSHPPEGVVEDEDYKPSAFVHPRYHWQYGGKKVWDAQDSKQDKDAFYGSHLLLDSPRLPHPPLDVVLAMDFVLANYYSATWKVVRLETEYRRLVKGAQDRYWRSYFEALQSNWSPTSGNKYSVDLMPFFYPS